VDLAIVGGTVVDGTGAPARDATVLVRGDRVADVLAPEERVGDVARTIDAVDRVVAPGFIDVHSHSDLTPFVEPTMDSMLRQGVTTLVVGNCGASAFPLANAPEMAALVGADPARLELGWATFGGYLERIDEAAPALNVAALIGHGTLRQAALDGHARPPTADELGRMRSLLTDALEAGALGMSTGLIYAPGLHADTDEIVALAEALAVGGGLYTSHVRGEGLTVFDAVRECIEVGRRAGVPSHVSHLKVETRPMWGRASELLELLDRERSAGADVSADQYPYTAWETELTSALPPWAAPDRLQELLADADARERLRAAVERGEPGWESAGRGIGWDRIVVGSHTADPTMTGRSIAEVAGTWGVEPFEAIARLVAADRFTGMLGHAMDEDDVREIVARPDVFVATDGVAISPDGPLGRFAVHPRYYGTFPRVLGRYVREERRLSLETAIAKMTARPADRFALAGRGRITRGAFADLVILDPGRVVDVATFERPHAFAGGIDVVVVNGRVSWDGARGTRAGRALRRGER
jgi:N-acyl-D-aspartate/D-glutamate deacylase